ncbi:spore morphogenesis/germination protein YwcE [Bacillus sp. Marseille-Q3570]|uniref:spore morphogenesis/germination protein YwcE n=1 Tax=Bacillales TaxID=1385 RepID=UPI0021B72370|nr:spore morphogenesis/germination protein YwcE [Bacillus sp. Marseille-Q3570]
MDVFLVYLLVASATPLFLWQDRKKLAILQIPFILCMWLYVVLYLSFDLSMLTHIVLGSIFVANVIFAHVAAFMIFTGHAFNKAKKI